MISQHKLDAIDNALLVGMAREDAYIYAGLTEDEIQIADSNNVLQTHFAKLTKDLEYSLLRRMGDIAEKQTRMGKEGATTWMLEHVFPRYSNKPTDTLPEIHLHLEDKEPESYDNVTIANT